MRSRQIVNRSVHEQDFQRDVIRLARMLGWRVYHQRAAMMRSGAWATAMQGDKGFPDLVLVRGLRLLFVELKSERGQLTEEQDRWLTTLRVIARNTRRGLSAVVEVYVWRPSMMQSIADILKREVA